MGALDDLKGFQTQLQSGENAEDDDDIPDLVEATNFEEIFKFDEQPDESKEAPATENLEEIS